MLTTGWRVLMAAVLMVSGPALGQTRSERAPTHDNVAGTDPARPVQAGETFVARAHHWSAWISGGRLVLVEDDGGGFNSAIIVNQDTIDFAITSLQWRVTPGSRYDMAITIDGQTFSGTAYGSNDTTIQMRDINNRFLQSLYWGQNANIRVNNYDLLLSLTGSKAIIDAGLRYLRDGR